MTSPPLEGDWLCDCLITGTNSIRLAGVTSWDCSALALSSLQGASASFLLKCALSEASCHAEEAPGTTWRTAGRPNAASPPWPTAQLSSRLVSAVGVRPRRASRPSQRPGNPRRSRTAWSTQRTVTSDYVLVSSSMMIQQ